MSGALAIKPPLQDERTYTLADHRRGECLWPMDGRGEEPPAEADHSRRVFCCASIEPGSPYCPGHTWDAYPGRRDGRRPATSNRRV